MLFRSNDYTLPCSNIAIVKRVLRNLATAYESIGNPLKKEQVTQLLRLIEDYQ